MKDLEIDELLNMDENGKNKRKKKLPAVKPTLISNMERVVSLAEQSELNPDFFKMVKDQLKFISEKLQISANEALLLSIFMEMSDMECIDMSRIGRFLNCSKLRLMSYQADVDSLRDKGYIKNNTHNTPFGDADSGYSVPKRVSDAIMANTQFVPEPIIGLTTDELFDRIGDIFECGGDAPMLHREIDNLLVNNKKLNYCKQVKKVLDKKLSPRDVLLFHYICNQLVNECSDEVTERDWRCIFMRRLDVRNLRDELTKGTHPLIGIGLIESIPDNGMFGPRFHLTLSAKQEFLKDLSVVEAQAKQAKDVLKSDTFAEKKLFYNPEEKKQIEQISTLLDDKKFRDVQKRLKETGMRTGFACLFYGAPGTGKTETVNQLARITGRDVMTIDVSQIKDKFVGESEKNIKEAFDRYRILVKNMPKAPILLFNEADAVLGIRKEGAQRAVDKMENSIQNIILQEMEKLDGIMIATTNLTKNLDSAFERRFIYKVEFKKPSVEAKKNIWLSMVPTMTDELAQTLAERYDFSGGQIENIARKRAVYYVLNGCEPTDADYLDYCDAELIEQKTTRSKVGFC